MSVQIVYLYWKKDLTLEYVYSSDGNHKENFSNYMFLLI